MLTTTKESDAIPSKLEPPVPIIVKKKAVKKVVRFKIPPIEPGTGEESAPRTKVDSKRIDYQRIDSKDQPNGYIALAPSKDELKDRTTWRDRTGRLYVRTSKQDDKRLWNALVALMETFGDDPSKDMLYWVLLPPVSHHNTTWLTDEQELRLTNETSVTVIDGADKTTYEAGKLTQDFVVVAPGPMPPNPRSRGTSWAIIRPIYKPAKMMMTKL